ncbi:MULTISPECIES: hypothetical protein [Pseudanabaena]|uniref:Uncharacterized protein n=1 Tax=Pseudanabaena catenata USMAC16 TaxID=1855837 RepID=A0A9X4RN81_9CYAN|nr:MULTISPECIES: hypothetical protein [Pseudanabaena]MDG3497024.1 hypothetical protein [Pseudanabaena catenata USMAC16]
MADDDIETLAINANVKGDGAGKGIGGTVKLVSKMGDILTDYVRTDSAGSIGGNITLDAGAALLSAAGIGGTVRAINSFSIAGQDFSLYAGIRSGAAIEVKYRDQSFAFGDATENGTKGMVMSGASLATDARFETLNLAPQSGYKTQLRLVSYASDPEKLKINSLIDKSYNDQYSSILVKTAQAIYSSQSIYFYLSSLLTNPSGALLGAIVAGFQAYLSEVQLLQKAKLLTGVAAFKDTKYFSNEAYSPDGTPLGNFVATNAESVAKYALPNIERLLVSARKFDVTDNAQIAYIMATASHETWFGIQDFYGSIKDHPALYEKGNGTFRSKDEYNYFQEAYGTYQFRGRGYVQLTGMEQYQTMQNKFGNQYGVNLLSVTNKNGSDNPWKWTYGADVVATNRNLAADITVYGMQKDLFRAPNPSSMPFNGYLNNTNDSNAKDNFTQARKIVNSYIDENGGIINKELDIAKNIASNAINYYDALNGKLIQNTSKV